MSGVPAFLKFDRKRFTDAADYLAIALIATLPWSTSATGILVVAWLVVLLPTLDWPSLRREIATAAGGLPVLLVVFAALGVLWADVTWSERAAGWISHLKLLVIPLLFVQFRRSDRGHLAVRTLLVSCAALLVLSYYIFVFLDLGGYPFAVKQMGVPVKDYISQSGFFILCAFVLIDMAVRDWTAQRRGRALLLAAGALAFLLNIVMVATGRTALLVMAVLLVVYALRGFGWKGRMAVLLLGTVLAGTAWTSSQYLRHRVTQVVIEINEYRDSGKITSSGQRLAFWASSFDIVTQAPVIGHGTGSIRAMFVKAAAGDVHSLVYNVGNPHNQTFAVAIQLGIVGAGLLWAMWLSHVLLFRGGGATSWFGMVVVVQNIVGSLVNSHLFDFTQGWTYVICVGIAGGMVQARDAATAASGPGHPPMGRPGGGTDANSGEPAKRPV